MAGFPIEVLFLSANTALLTGIFFKLGKLTGGLEGHDKRISNLEGKTAC